MIKIDLNHTTTPHFISNDYTEFKFGSVQRDGRSVELVVHIKPAPIPFLPDVFNLAFGPLDAEGQIDDTARMSHFDINKVFSSIILCTLLFLDENPDVFIGIDGSDEIRAYLYHRMFTSNHKCLSSVIRPVGVDWYVRFLRNGNFEVDDTGAPFLKPKPEPFDILRKSTDLYTYYLYSLNF